MDLPEFEDYPRRTVSLDAKNQEFTAGTSRSLERGISQALCEAVERGRDRVSKKCAWPFDFYQATNLYPVDYHYWWSQYDSCVGNTQLVMMHATTLIEDGSELAADQMFARERMRNAHLGALKNFLASQSMTFAPYKNEDPQLRHTMTWTDYARERSML